MLEQIMAPLMLRFDKIERKSDYMQATEFYNLMKLV